MYILVYYRRETDSFLKYCVIREVMRKRVCVARQDYGQVYIQAKKTQEYNIDAHTHTHVNAQIYTRCKSM